MAAKIFQNFIGGEWVESHTGQNYENLNPADTRDVIGVFQRSDKRDVDDAVLAARQAFERWRLVPAPRRAEIIYRAGEILLERKEEYALTEKGLDLIPVLVEMANWSAQYDPQTGAPPAWIALMKAKREEMIERMRETVRSGGAVFVGENSLISQLA